MTLYKKGQFAAPFHGVGRIPQGIAIPVATGFALSGNRPADLEIKPSDGKYLPMLHRAEPTSDLIWASPSIEQAIYPNWQEIIDSTDKTPNGKVTAQAAAVGFLEADCLRYAPEMRMSRSLFGSYKQPGPRRDHEIALFLLFVQLEFTICPICQGVGNVPHFVKDGRRVEKGQDPVLEGCVNCGGVTGPGIVEGWRAPARNASINDAIGHLLYVSEQFNTFHITIPDPADWIVPNAYNLNRPDYKDMPEWMMDRHFNVVWEKNSEVIGRWNAAKRGRLYFMRRDRLAVGNEGSTDSQ